MYVVIAILGAMSVFSALMYALARASAAAEEAAEHMRRLEATAEEADSDRLNEEYRRYEEEFRMRPYAEHSVYLGP